MDHTNLNTAVGTAFSEELARLGVELAVVSPGSRSTPLALALEREPGIEVEVVLDERSAAFFALGAANATGLPVALVCTSGSAAANYLPAVTEADLSAVPLLLLTADRPPELRGIGAGQAIDQLKLYGDAVRWFAEVGNPRGDDEGLLFVRQLACRAFATAAGDPRPGPVHLNFPFREPLAPRPGGEPITAETELALEGRGDEPLATVSEPLRLPTSEGLERALALLEGRSRIAIVAGRLPDPSATDAAVALSEVLSAPILAEPTSQLRWGTHSKDTVVWAYDLILRGGTGVLLPPPETVVRIGETPTSAALRRWVAGHEGADQIMVRPEGDWYDPSRLARVILRSDIGPTLERIREGVEPPPSREYLDQWLSAQEGLAPDSEVAGIHLAVAETAPEGSIIYTASSLAIRDQETFLPTGATEILFLANRGTNGIDGLIASAAGAGRGSDRPVIAVTGDLGMVHDMASLPLISRCGAGVRIVVVNDGGGRIFETLPAAEVLSRVEFERLMLTPTDVSFEDLARTAALEHVEVRDSEGLHEALRKRGPLLIEYRLERASD